MMMVYHPEVAVKAQREIDSIIGSDPERLPTIEDRNNLPYLECMLKELYRINPVVPGGLYHTSTANVKLREWTIPKGAMAIPNIWYVIVDTFLP